MTDATDDRHWIEIVDARGFYPAKLLGPYASARLAERAGRGAMRLLNVDRYAATVVSQQALAVRQQASEGGGHHQFQFVAEALRDGQQLNFAIMANPPATR